jgi:hypothetical protein
VNERLGDLAFAGAFTEFVNARPGQWVLLGISVFVAASGAYSASRKAEHFKLTHAFAAFGSFSVMGSIALYTSDPAYMARLIANIPPRLHLAEALATQVGCLLGGMLGWRMST